MHPSHLKNVPKRVPMRRVAGFIAPASLRVSRSARVTTREYRSAAICATKSAPSTSRTTSPPTASSASLAPRYACPDCRAPVDPLIQEQCSNCDAPFSVRRGFFDLASKQTRTFRSSQPIRQSLFQSPLVSFAYERGWRNQFKVAGFPGPDAEFKLICDFFFPKGNAKDESASGTVLDLSCGSGLMARRMVSSGLFSRVVAADLSSAMLEEALSRASAEGLSFDAVRLDVAHLPFQDKSLPFVHAGAALHCWPLLQDGLSEVHVRLSSTSIVGRAVKIIRCALVD
jgi:hypothetical protein